MRIEDLRPTATYRMMNRLRELYEGDNPRGIHFRYGLLLFDLVVILFLVVSSFFPGTRLTELTDVVLGLVILADFSVRMLLRGPACAI